MRTTAVRCAALLVGLAAVIGSACGGDSELTIDKAPPDLVLQQSQLPSPLYQQTSNTATDGGNGQVVEYHTPTGITIKSTVTLFDSEAAAVDHARALGEQYVADGYERGPEDRIGDFTLVLSRVDLPGGEPTSVPTASSDAATAVPTVAESGSAGGMISHVIIATRGRAVSEIDVSGQDVTLGAARILADLVLTNIDPKYPTPDVS
jgi:hypothetical protein